MPCRYGEAITYHICIYCNNRCCYTHDIYVCTYFVHLNLQWKYRPVLLTAYQYEIFTTAPIQQVKWHMYSTNKLMTILVAIHSGFDTLPLFSILTILERSWFRPSSPPRTYILCVARPFVASKLSKWNRRIRYSRPDIFIVVLVVVTVSWNPGVNFVVHGDINHFPFIRREHYKPRRSWYVLK